MGVRLTTQGELARRTAITLAELVAHVLEGADVSEGDRLVRSKLLKMLAVLFLYKSIGYHLLIVSIIQIQRWLRNRSKLRCKAVREDGRAVFPNQRQTAPPRHRGLLFQLRALWRYEPAGHERN